MNSIVCSIKRGLPGGQAIGTWWTIHGCGLDNPAEAAVDVYAAGPVYPDWAVHII